MNRKESDEHKLEAFHNMPSVKSSIFDLPPEYQTVQKLSSLQCRESQIQSQPTLMKPEQIDQVLVNRLRLSYHQKVEKLELVQFCGRKDNQDPDKQLQFFVLTYLEPLLDLKTKSNLTVLLNPQAEMVI